MYSIINFVMSPVIGLTCMMEKFGSNYIRNRFRHTVAQVNVILLPTMFFFAQLAYLGFKTTQMQIYIILNFYTLMICMCLHLSF